MDRSDHISAADARRELAQLGEDQRVTMNLMELILSGDNALAWSDGESYLICQSDPRTPVWAWLVPDIGNSAAARAADILAACAKRNPGVHLHVPTAAGAGVLRLVEERTGRLAEKVMDMNAYVCRRVREPAYRGELSAPGETDCPAMASLLRQLAQDGEHQTIPQEEADGFAAAMVGAGILSLWRDDGRVCAMAMVAHRTETTARINTVVTDRALRGRGYAGMLTARLCWDLLAKGAVPMLYADAANPSSNRAYQKIGFEKVGEVTEYRLAEGGAGR